MVILEDNMKLVIQIPLFSEEKTLPLVLNDLPKKIISNNVLDKDEAYFVI